MFDNLISQITKTISPNKGLEMMKQGIEKALNKKIDHFKMFYLSEKEDILFHVFLPDGQVIKDSYKGNNKGMIIFIVKNLAKTKLKTDETLDLVMCEYNPDQTINLDICMTSNGEKVKHTINNYKP